VVDTDESTCQVTANMDIAESLSARGDPSIKQWEHVTSVLKFLTFVRQFLFLNWKAKCSPTVTGLRAMNHQMGWSSGNAMDSYSGCALFESRSEHRLS
jgi:hypothetical protein